jgi:uncharacterized membrane protein YqjE
MSFSLKFLKKNGLMWTLSKMALTIMSLLALKMSPLVTLSRLTKSQRNFAPFLILPLALTEWNIDTSNPLTQKEKYCVPSTIGV